MPMKTIVSELPMRRNFLHGFKVVEVGCPWLTYGAIIALEHIVRHPFVILEIGAGGSTIFFSRRGKTVKCLENRQEWIDRIRAKVPDPSNITFVSGSLNELLEIVKKEPNDYYDLVMVDTNPKDRAIYEEASKKVKKGGYLVLNNYGAREYRGFNYRGWDTYDFDDIKWYGRGTRISIKR
jgi:hypothetical protein